MTTTTEEDTRSHNADSSNTTPHLPLSCSPHTHTHTDVRHSPLSHCPILPSVDVTLLTHRAHHLDLTTISVPSLTHPHTHPHSHTPASYTVPTPACLLMVKRSISKYIHTHTGFNTRPQIENESRLAFARIIDERRAYQQPSASSIKGTMASV